MLPTCPYCKEEMAFFYYQNVFICINDKCEGKKANNKYIDVFIRINDKCEGKKKNE